MCLMYNILCQQSKGPRIYLSNPPLDTVAGVLPWKNQEWLDKLKELKEWHQKPGNHEMTLNELKAKKNSLVEELKEDTCHEDATSGNIRCAEVLRAFQDIYKNWRGVCKYAFMGWCQPWASPAGPQSTITYKCSFFIKVDRGYAPPLHGYSFKAQDCVDHLGLEIEKFEKSTTPEANKAIEPAASSPGRKRRQKKGKTGQIGGN
ncbi:unnamed protein product [Bemisia tabaci]|uniref:Uncharacterized protein n=1 Tax=Bemisia tabaci TaxID=7038 RepID=A0A9P0A2Y8_BEMTA|nr:unnamed protein product [Bemisia tabaci]